MKTLSATPTASSEEVLAHFTRLLALETDCWDVHASLASGDDMLLLDVRSPDAFATGHIAGAINMPHRLINAATMSIHPHGQLVVVYCAGPHCNGADRAAIAVARLGRPVKKMIGGITGWLDEGFPLIQTPQP